MAPCLGPSPLSRVYFTHAPPPTGPHLAASAPPPGAEAGAEAEEVAYLQESVYPHPPGHSATQGSAAGGALPLDYSKVGLGAAVCL